jgi:hydrogenase nickel incorporation protein HypB
MEEIKFIDLKECILSDNNDLAAEIKVYLKKNRTFLMNVMSSPGAGKTTFILDVIRRLKGELRIAVIEGDIESRIDAEKMQAEGIPVVQLRTGGDCHLDAAMIKEALDYLDIKNLDLILIENIGNLVCPAEFDLGAGLQSMILSVPEGDDKVIKYPLMFSVCQVLVVSKIDTKSYFDFDTERLRTNARKLNPSLVIYEVSAKTGQGMTEWCTWLKEQVYAFID